MATLIDIEKIKPIDFPSTEMDGLDVVQYLNTLPTVDAVEVVRCRDCKHRYNSVHCTHPQLLSWSWGAIRECKDDDYCSYGERKYYSNKMN